MVSLDQLFDRDFPKKDKPMIHLDQHINQVVSDITSLFVNFDEFVQTKSTYLLDTCSFIKKNISEYDRNKIYIITCGVFRNPPRVYSRDNA